MFQSTDGGACSFRFNPIHPAEFIVDICTRYTYSVFRPFILLLFVFVILSAFYRDEFCVNSIKMVYYYLTLPESETLKVCPRYVVWFAIKNVMGSVEKKAES